MCLVWMLSLGRPGELQRLVDNLTAEGVSGLDRWGCIETGVLHRLDCVWVSLKVADNAQQCPAVTESA
jgi:hypothetical protein